MTQLPAANLLAALGMICLEIPAWVQSPHGLPSMPEPILGEARRGVVVEVDSTILVVKEEGTKLVVPLAGLRPEGLSPASTEASNFLRNLLLGEAVRFCELKPPVGQAPTSRHPSYLVYREPDGTLANVEAIRQGYCRVSDDLTGDFHKEFKGQEAQAQRIGKGIWTTSSPEVAPPTRVVSCYQTRVEEDKDDILLLENGAAVHVNGYLGYLAYRKAAVLYGSVGAWKILLEGKHVVACDVIRAPDIGVRSNAELVTLSKVKGRGSILFMDDKSIWEVNRGEDVISQLWIAPFNGLLIEGSRLLNLDDGESVQVTRVQ